MKKLLIIFTVLALSSCRESQPREVFDVETKGYVSSSELCLGLVLSQMHIDGNLILKDKEYQITELEESKLEQMWFDFDTYKAALSLLDRLNKELKETLARFEKQIGTDDYILHDALNQIEYANMSNSPGAGKWQGLTLNSYDTLPVTTSYKVSNGETRQIFICYDREMSTNHTAINDCIHLIATRIKGEIHVYITILSGPVFIELPGDTEEVEVIYMTSFPEGGYCIW